MSFNQEALTLGRIQVAFDCLYSTKEMLARLSTSERTRELLRMCDSEGVSFNSFCYLERALITERCPNE